MSGKKNIFNNWQKGPIVGQLLLCQLARILYYAFLMIYITVYIDITVYYNDCYDDTIFISVKIKMMHT